MPPGYRDCGAGGNGDAASGEPAGAPVVTVTRQRDPLEGQRLPVLGRLRRHGGAELLVVLPDGSKRLIPAAWTDADASAADDASANGRDTRAGRRICCGCRSWFRAFCPGGPTAGAGCTEVTGQGGRPCSLSSSVCCRTRFRRHHPRPPRSFRHLSCRRRWPSWPALIARAAREGGDGDE